MKQTLHREIEEVNEELAKAGQLVRAALRKALEALKNQDAELANQVHHEDDEVDRLEVAIEERLLKLFVLYQPVARDLRFLVTALKVNNELEHIGDYADSIAMKVRAMDVSAGQQTELEVFDMGQKVDKMIEMAMDSFINQDLELAKQVIHLDDVVDAAHSYNHRMIRNYIEDSEKVFRENELRLLSVSRSLERVADTACSIAEDVIYFIEGRIVRHNPVI